MNIFKYEDHQLRTIDIEGEPWFHATDVCKCLMLSVSSGTYMHTQKLDADEKQTLHRTPKLAGGLDEFIGRTASATVVNESGLYRLILRADGVRAKPFQDWVVKKVLPAIRRTGGYTMNEEARKTAYADTMDEMPLPAGD